MCVCMHLVLVQCGMCEYDVCVCIWWMHIVWVCSMHACACVCALVSACVCVWS